MVNYNQFSESDDKKGLTGHSRATSASQESLKEIKYVITNPQKNIKLRADDLVFVLSQNDPNKEETWDDYNYFNNKK